MRKLLSTIINQMERNRELLLYLVFGVLTTCVSWGSYSALVYWAKLSVGIGNALSWIFATAFAFLTNKAFVFCSNDWNLSVVLKETIAFVTSRLGTGLFEVVAVPLVVSLGFTYRVFGIDGSAAKICISLIVVIANYFLSKMIVFRGKKDHGRH